MEAGRPAAGDDGPSGKLLLERLRPAHPKLGLQHVLRLRPRAGWPQLGERDMLPVL